MYPLWLDNDEVKLLSLKINITNFQLQVVWRG